MTPAQRPPPTIDPDQLTEHFHLSEFTRSDTAKTLGIVNTPLPQHRANLLRHAKWLEILRRLVGGRRVTIHSGYRCPALNAAVKGVEDSDHAQGDASDLTIEGLTPRDTALLIQRLIAEGKLPRIDQVIMETSRRVVHVSTAPRLRMQFLTQAGGPGSPVAKGIIGG